jgi:hypothetical protein
VTEHGHHFQKCIYFGTSIKANRRNLSKWRCCDFTTTKPQTLSTRPSAKGQQVSAILQNLGCRKNNPDEYSPIKENAEKAFNRHYFIGLRLCESAAETGNSCHIRRWSNSVASFHSLSLFANCRPTLSSQLPLRKYFARFLKELLGHPGRLTYNCRNDDNYQITLNSLARHSTLSAEILGSRSATIRQPCTPVGSARSLCDRASLIACERGPVSDPGCGNSISNGDVNL